MSKSTCNTPEYLCGGSSDDSKPKRGASKKSSKSGPKWGGCKNHKLKVK